MLTDEQKKDIQTKSPDILLEFISLPIRVMITNPEYIYCEINSTVKYDSNLTTKQINDY